MFETKITEMLEIKYPIIGGNMMWISNADFVAAVSNAGGLGILNSIMHPTEEEFSSAIDRVRELTDKPFAVNINFFPARFPVPQKQYVDIMAEKGVNIVETSGPALEEDLCRSLKGLGMIWIHKCVAARHALKVQKMGADIVTVVGYENGGAVGMLEIGTLVLVPAVVNAVKIPVIGGGGVSDGRGLAALLSLGAQGVIMGTRLLMTQECPIHDNLKQSLTNATETDTMLIMRSLGAAHRVWTNKAAHRCAELDKSGEDPEEIINIAAGDNAKRMYTTGDLDCGTVSCGQGVGLSEDIVTVKELFDRIMQQAEETVTGLIKS
jgi:nitronate monooxygenase